MIFSLLMVAGALLGPKWNLHAAAPPSQAGPPPFSIRWAPEASEPKRVVIEVIGLDESTLRELRQTDWTQSQWQRLLSVYVDQGSLLADVGLPPIVGEYRLVSNVLRFEPQFPLQRGIKYRAVFSPNRLPGKPAPARIVTSTFQMPANPATRTTVVANIFPTSDLLPENLLKFYVHFSAPMSGGHIYEHIRLRDEAGKDVDLPFLEIDEELWNPSMTRLTLFIDPGRIKRGVQPLEEVGPALEEGKGYTLSISANWRDASDTPLKEDFHKRFRVGPTDRTPIDLSLWKIQSPKAGTRDPLAVAFSEPIDHALALRVIRVLDAASQPIDGGAALVSQERHWSFTPAQPWRRGAHYLSVQSTIEDLAGNNVGKAFEVDLFEGVQRRFTNSTVKLPFAVQ